MGIIARGERFLYIQHLCILIKLVRAGPVMRKSPLPRPNVPRPRDAWRSSDGRDTRSVFSELKLKLRMGAPFRWAGLSASTFPLPWRAKLGRPSRQKLEDQIESLLEGGPRGC